MASPAPQHCIPSPFIQSSDENGWQVHVHSSCLHIAVSNEPSRPADMLISVLRIRSRHFRLAQNDKFVSGAVVALLYLEPVPELTQLGRSRLRNLGLPEPPKKVAQHWLISYLKARCVLPFLKEYFLSKVPGQEDRGQVQQDHPQKAVYVPHAPPASLPRQVSHRLIDTKFRW